MVVALSRGLPVRFKSARVVLVASEHRPLADLLSRMGIADVCCISDMMAARVRCDAGDIDACLVVLPRAVPDDKPDWDARTDAPGKGCVPSLLIVEATTPYVLRAAADAGYQAVVPSVLSSRMLYRCLAALLQGGRRQDSQVALPSRRPRGRPRRIAAIRAFGRRSVSLGKLKLQ
jgi:hypothetical protein